ncbi:MAG: sulfotransferase family protein [Planctomycetota bacterium]|nr:sulfotransferase family protein [Planctomycetota bacterium]
MKWPQCSYLVDPQRKLLCCPVPRAASTTLKAWMLRASGVSAAEVQKKPLSLELVRAICLDRLPAREASAILTDGSHFRFTFVRNPWTRLVSAYLGKFVPLMEPALGALHGIRRDEGVLGLLGSVRSRLGLGRPADVERGATFRQFVRHLERRGTTRVNGHWRAQHRFLADHEFDFIGRFESLQRDLAQVEERAGVKIGWPNRHPTQYSDDEHEPGSAADWERSQLLKLKRYPRAQAFYTPELTDIVGRLYAEDVRRFDYAPPWA